MTKSLKKTIIENFNIDNEIQGIGMDIIGDSAIINLPDVLQTNSKKIAELILNENKQIKSIYLQKSKIKGKFRTSSNGIQYIPDIKEPEFFNNIFGTFIFINMIMLSSKSRNCKLK